MTKELWIRCKLEDETVQQLAAIKKALGLKLNTEVIRYLIHNYYNKMVKEHH